MKRINPLIPIALVLAAVGCLAWWFTLPSFSRYTDPAFGYSFELPRRDVSALGWLKPSDADINKGVVTSLGYENGFFLQIYRPVQGPAANFAAFGQQVYERGLKNDRSRTYQLGRFAQVGGERAFIFETEVKFNGGEHYYEYWPADRIFDPNEAKDDRQLTPARVAYLTHEGHYFRIIYDPHDPRAERTFYSFRFF